jgi:hypothetical protein
VRALRLTALLLLGLGACASQLPSERPLGIGPLARARPPSEPSGSPVTMPGSATPTMIESDEDDGDGDGDEDTTKRVSSATSDTAPDAGVTSMADAGAAPSSAPSSAPATGTPDFVGEYAGRDRSIFRLDGAVVRQEDDPKALMSVKKSGTGLAFVIVASNTGDPLCTLNATQKGDTVTLATGQQCPEPRSPFAPGKVTSGKGKLQGKTLELDVLFEASIEVEGEQHKGGIDYHFDGTRR